MWCGGRLERLPVGIVSHTKHHVGEPLLKGRVIGELFVEFHVIGHQTEHFISPLPAAYDADICLVLVLNFQAHIDPIGVQLNQCYSNSFGRERAREGKTFPQIFFLSRTWLFA